MGRCCLLIIHGRVSIRSPLLLQNARDFVQVPLGSGKVRPYTQRHSKILNGLLEISHVKEVNAVTFPDEDKYCYHMVEGEETKFLELMNK